MFNAYYQFGLAYGKTLKGSDKGLAVRVIPYLRGETSIVTLMRTVEQYKNLKQGLIDGINS